MTSRCTCFWPMMTREISRSRRVTMSAAWSKASVVGASSERVGEAARGWVITRLILVARVDHGQRARKPRMAGWDAEANAGSLACTPRARRTAEEPRTLRAARAGNNKATADHGNRTEKEQTLHGKQQQQTPAEMPTAKTREYLPWHRR
jgi:hypothetical protein